MRLTVINLWRYERSTMYRAIPHLSPIGLSVIHQADEKHVECYIPTVYVSLTPLVLNALVSELSYSLRGESLSSPNYYK